MHGTLSPGEPHPAAPFALSYIKSLPAASLAAWQESLSSNAIGGNRTAEICSETLHRIMESQPVSDRYLLGLAWTLRELEAGVVK